MCCHEFVEQQSCELSDWKSSFDNFFPSLSMQKAHWYLIIFPTDIDDEYDLLC